MSTIEIVLFACIFCLFVGLIYGLKSVYSLILKLAKMTGESDRTILELVSKHIASTTELAKPSVENMPEETGQTVKRRKRNRKPA